MPSLMHSSSNSQTNGYHIAYEELRDLQKDYWLLAKELSIGTRRCGTGKLNDEIYRPLYDSLWASEAARAMNIWENDVIPAFSRCDFAANRALRISDAIGLAASLTEQNERKIVDASWMASGNGAGPLRSHDTEGHAEGFYAAAIAAEEQKKKDDELAEQARIEQEQKDQETMDNLDKWCPGLADEIRAEMDKAAMLAWIEELRKENPELAARIEAYLQAQEDAETAAKEQAEWDKFMEGLWGIAPETAQELQDKMDKEALDKWLQEVKEKHPELYDKIVAELKRQEEAQKAAAEAAAAMEAELSVMGDLDGSGWGSGSGDLGDGLGGSDWGSSDLSAGLGGSDFGSAASDWGGASEWTSDLLEDTIDGEELATAGEALDSIAGATLGADANQGADAISDAALEGGDGSFWSTYGPQLASFAHAYGVQAAATLGGAAVLYATREQTTEAVAYMAEFVSTKCKPFASDVMDQVKGAAKQTRVSISNTKSKVVGAVRGEEVGDLIG